MEFHLLQRAIRGSASWLTLAVVIGALLGLGAWYVLPSAYQASSVLVMDSTAVTVPGQQPFSGDPERYVTSEMELLRGRDIADEAGARVTPPLTGEDVLQAISLSHVTGTDVVTVSARAGSASEAEAVAQAVTATYVERRQAASQAAVQAQRQPLEDRARALESRLSSEDLSPALASALSVQAAQVAEDLARLADPGAVRDGTRVIEGAGGAVLSRAVGLLPAVLAGAGLAALLALVGAVLRESRRPHVTDADQVSLITGRPVAAVFPRVRRADLRKGRSLLRRVDEPARRLAARLAPAGSEARPVVIAVSSAATTAAVSSTVWALLALSLARDGLRVLAVTLESRPEALALLGGTPTGDAPTRHASGRSESVGNASADQSVDASAGDSDSADQVGSTGWVWSPAAAPGVIVSRRPDRLRPTAEDVLNGQPGELAAFDAVVVDAPPVNLSGLAQSLARTADEVVLVVPVRGQSESDLRLAVTAVEEEGKAALHVVVARP
ncbi:hypothetical protein [Geodermatophilus nigrescens]|uniref:hypothetical protein n=1 Tax=Geodermatophilus nigrescens TaxID=1070870 RepID=UPI000933CFA2|nr:hypothetical protein [Geodermatophilus nigrescens]